MKKKIKSASKIKYSEIFINFSNPLVGNASEDDLDYIFELCQLAWNIGLIPLEEQKDEIDKICIELNYDIIEKMDMIKMVKRYNENFREHKFFIVDFNVDYDEEVDEIKLKVLVEIKA